MLDHIAKELNALPAGLGSDPSPSDIINVNDFKWSFLKFKRKVNGGAIQARNPSKQVLEENFKKLPTGVAQDILSEHTGRSQTLKVSNISLGALGTLLDKFEDDFVAEIIIDLDEIGINLD